MPRDSGDAQATISVTVDAHMPPLVLAWLLAAMVHISMGSATGTGSLILSHAKIPGFWMIQFFFKRS